MAKSINKIKLFDDFISNINIENPKFEERTKVHDWRNYVPFEWMNKWNEFSEREKKIIAVMAEMQAVNEDWN